MPITPFHFGPGALLKAAAPRHVSWTTFALANGLIDLEPILLFLFTGEPAHESTEAEIVSCPPEDEKANDMTEL